ncbi:MAG: ankyrin repeat domain-containing protein, partial [Burkholderiales bacterium]
AKPTPEPKPAAKPAPEPEPAPVVMAAAPAPAASSPPPAAEPKPAPSLVAPTAVVPPVVAPLRGPPPINPKYNDVMTAVLYGDREAVSELLDLGRWVDKPDSNGLTPLMAAVLSRDAGMVQLLLERGADPNLQAPGGEVALEMARDNGDGASESLLLKARGRY